MWYQHLAAVEKHHQRILDALDYIWRNPVNAYDRLLSTLVFPAVGETQEERFLTYVTV